MLKKEDVVSQLQQGAVFTQDEVFALGAIIHDVTRNFSDVEAEERMVKAVLSTHSMVEALTEITMQTSVELKKTRRRMQWFAAKYDTLKERGEAMIEALERFSDAMLYGKDAAR